MLCSSWDSHGADRLPQTWDVARAPCPSFARVSCQPGLGLPSSLSLPSPAPVASSELLRCPFSVSLLPTGAARPTPSGSCAIKPVSHMCPLLLPGLPHAWKSRPPACGVPETGPRFVPGPCARRAPSVQPKAGARPPDRSSVASKQEAGLRRGRGGTWRQKRRTPLGQGSQWKWQT